MTQEAFKAWWYSEGSQAPYTHHDCEEHTMRMCEIAWANGAYKEREEANARANASWTLMCKKMVAIEREACAKIVEVEAMQYAEPVWAFEIVNDIRDRSNGNDDVAQKTNS